MKRIDSHQHFWKYDSLKHDWINDEMAVLKKDFLPSELQEVYKANNISKCVAVQADQSEEETNFLLKLSDGYGFISGVVAWVDLRASKFEERLEYYAQKSKLVGFRHVVQSEPDPDFVLQPAFLEGISKLNKYNFTYDILIYPHQMAASVELVNKFPHQKFVIDHIAKPYIKNGEIDYWERAMVEFSKLENVWCKVSGMITEANWFSWKYDDLLPYLDVVFEAFGTHRIMYGSDWPVCLLAGSYEDVIGILEKYVKSFSQSEKEDIWYNSAKEFYDL